MELIRVVLRRGLYFFVEVFCFSCLTAELFLSNCSAELLKTKEQALTVAFGEELKIEEELLILSPEQQTDIEQSSRSKLSSGLFEYYRLSRNGELLGYATVDSQIIRTLNANFLIALTPQGQIKQVIILSFNEPREYLPGERWLANFSGKESPADLFPQKGIPPIAGSSLSVDSIAASVRRVLSVFKLAILKQSPK